MFGFGRCVFTGIGDVWAACCDLPTSHGSDLLCSPHPLQPLPAGLWYFVCSLHMVTPQLKCDCRCVSKEGAEKVLADELALRAPPLSLVLLQKMIIIPGVDPIWLMSHNWKTWKPLFCVSSLYVLTRMITHTTSCREEEYFLWKWIHAASLVDKPDVTQTFFSSLFKGKACCTHMTNCLLCLLRSDYFVLYLTYANERDDNGLCFISACHSFC